MKNKHLLASNWTTVGLLLLGVTFLGIGMWREEYTIVMEKAINICLECVGIG